jgi:hypothetical protein
MPLILSFLFSERTVRISGEEAVHVINFPKIQVNVAKPHRAIGRDAAVLKQHCASKRTYIRGVFLRERCDSCLPLFPSGTFCSELSGNNLSLSGSSSFFNKS